MQSVEPEYPAEYHESLRCRTIQPESPKMGKVALPAESGFAVRPIIDMYCPCVAMLVISHPTESGDYRAQA